MKLSPFKLHSCFQVFVTLTMILCLMGGTLLLNGCGEKPVEKPSAETPEEETGGNEGEVDPEATPTKPKKAPPLPTFEQLSELPFTPLTWQTPDGAILSGKLYDLHQNAEKLKSLKAAQTAPPADPETIEAAAEAEDPVEPETDDDGNPIVVQPPTPPAPKHRYPLLVLVHGLGRSQKEWAGVISTIVQAGYAVLAVDLRGHGTSTQRRPSNDPKDPNSISWRYLPTDQWRLLPSDLEQILTAFAHPKLHPKETAVQVLESPVVLVGAGLGANVALMVASHQPRNVKAVVALSPLLSVKGLEPALGALTLKAPVFFAATQADPDSFDATQTLFKLTQSEAKKLKCYKSIGSGEELLTADAGLLPNMLDWLHER
jgi:alpha-beta hydrolase superfamily lysophospholipase